MERTTDEIAAIFKAAGDSVTLINTEPPDVINQEWKDTIKRNWQHLEIIKAYKKADKTTSLWTTEDFTDIDAAIVKGKAVQT
tara:strand:- start:608 stop:853 length:246 start_codon:yes stop_codon:yes gene_type:complete